MFKKWWCYKCKEVKGCLSTKDTTKKYEPNKYALRICKHCGEVVVEIKK